MTLVCTDRGEIIHLAGFHHLSPALDARGRPAFSTGSGDGHTRCGWEAFFQAMESHGLTISCDPADPSSARFVPAREARSEEMARGGLAHALAEARRFWTALFQSAKNGGRRV